MADVSRLPGPNTDFWDWQLQGACRGEDPSVFFHPEGERGAAREARANAAKAICGRCPVLNECSTHALATREPYGVWGAMSEDDREVIYKRKRAMEREKRVTVADVLIAAPTATGKLVS
jgi:WhiB family redox-sensing transcriptional regulator